MTDKLNPCHCGGKAKLWEGDWALTDHGVTCTKCHIIFDPVEILTSEQMDGLTSEEATIKAWNNRLLNVPNEGAKK